MKKILGLDLGTNSIGWALIDSEEHHILGMGSRIIPMDQGVLDTFSGGNPIETQTSARTSYRSTRRLRERALQRRGRLHRVLNVMGFLPEHYAAQIDFDKQLGSFYTDREPKLAWKQMEDGAFDFLFRNSFNEMLEDFTTNGLLKDNKKVPYDWTIYYLRKKALSKKIEKEELAWILLNFNQKRGYYQLRGEDEEVNPNKLVEYHSLKVVDVIPDEKTNNKGEKWYSLLLENGWIYRRSSKISLMDWKDKVRDFIVTTDINDDGSVKKDKEGAEKRTFRAPKEDDWTLLKKKTESDIAHSNKTVGVYIYETLLQNPNQKIHGKLVSTIERYYYKNELKEILEKQKEFHPELSDIDLFNDCVRELYRSNETHQTDLGKRDFTHLFLNDIIFYQRPLRSKKSLIGNCSLEYLTYKDESGNSIRQYLKATPKSNPYYQEFRLWQWIANLRIYRKDDSVDVTCQFFDENDDKELLFDFLNNRKEIEQKALLDYLIKEKGLKKQVKSEDYRWNYVEDKKYPCNETKAIISSRLLKVDNVPSNFLTKEVEYQLWHIIYSVKDKKEFLKALSTFAEKRGLDTDSFVENFKKLPPFENEYGSLSEKAIKKLLPLLRLGKYWQWNDIDPNTQHRIMHIITGEYDTNIKERVREKAIRLTNENDFQGLQLWLAQYIVYDRHSEGEVTQKWQSVGDIDNYLDSFRQHSLRNPIVEQVVMETLRVVRDIWLKFGQGAKDYFSEIHIELGRDMKNNADERKRLTARVTDNENTNMRIKALLVELKNNSDGMLSVENVRPYSPVQQEILQIFEEGALNSGEGLDEDIRKISKMEQPTTAELQRYKLWLDQKYCSPYTGMVIPLSKLFTEDYQIEHIIPKSRYYDDSLSNKVICEAAVNKLKDKCLALEFIKNYHGQIVELGLGRTATILDESSYKLFVKKHYANNHLKSTKLLMEDIPDKMIERQLNDTRFISKFISSLLSNLVRESKGDDGVNSKNILPGNGKITGMLKQDWGLTDVWNDIVLPRFERMNSIHDTSVFTSWNEQHHKFLPSIPLELSKGFQKKRIDHRHHAMDALVIACTTRDHINLLNNRHANSDNTRYDLQKKLRVFEKVTYTHAQTGELISKTIPKEFRKPWDSFTSDAYRALENVVVSFKQNLRVINKATNMYEKFENGKKVRVKQDGTNWAIRKPLHKETVFAKISLRKIKTVKLNEAIKNWNSLVDKNLKLEIKRLIALNKAFNPEVINKYFKDRAYKFEGIDISKVDVYYYDNDVAAVRKSLDTSFTEKTIIESVTDTGIQKILLNHLREKGNDPALAFSPEGIEDMNKNIVYLNGGKFHQPILKVRMYEKAGNKFAVGTQGNKKDKYVESAKGTNLFFAIYIDENGKRYFDSIPLNVVIERLKQGLSEVPETNNNGSKLLFFLSPNDLVYVPDINKDVDFIDPKRIYKMVSCTGSQCCFIQQSVSSPIVNKSEFSPLNKMERSVTGEMIKELCVKLIVDRLGNVINKYQL